MTSQKVAAVIEPDLQLVITKDIGPAGDSKVVYVSGNSRSVRKGMTRREILVISGVLFVFVVSAIALPIGLFLRFDEPSFGGRQYYVAAEQIEWDYAPSGKNGITGQDFDEAARVFVANGPTRIGLKYQKVVYREYTDHRFLKLKERPEWAGILGPIFRARVGDEIRVTFLNRADWPISIHPHGVFYDKDNEGAMYNDGSCAQDKMDDAVEPGATFVYNWKVPERAGPGPSDPSSVAWLYHSHMDVDIYAGLFGAIIISRANESDASSAKPLDVADEFVVVFQVINENASPLIDTNIDMYCANATDVDADDEDFVESNLMHSMNGHVYGNLPGLTLQQNKKARWHVIALGTEVDIHTPRWEGQVLVDNGRTTDSWQLLAASQKTLDMYPDVAGTFVFQCNVNDHIMAGMSALFTVVADASVNATATPQVAHRTYYVAAVEETWDYAPLGVNGYDGSAFDETARTWVESNSTRIGSRYKKALFREYTDASFSTQVARTDDWKHLGLLGPAIRAVVGETIKVVFKNMAASRSYNLRPSGVVFNRTVADAAVAPGETVESWWVAAERSGPSSKDVSSVVWLYHSSVNQVEDTYAGLLGAIIVTRSGANATADGRPSDVDREFVLVFSVFNENNSPYLAENMAGLSVRASDEGFIESNLKHSVNGYVFSNMGGVTAAQNERVRWYIAAWGTEVDMHTPRFFGQAVVSNGNRVDVLGLLPGSTRVADMLAYHPGTWKIACQVGDHITAGMVATYNVTADGSGFDAASLMADYAGVTRTYYVAAVDEEWNYVPSGKDLEYSGAQFSDEQLVYVGREAARIGAAYKKSLYVEFTDATFTTRKTRSSVWQHLGFLGPLIRAEVGDTVQVVFWNNASIPCNMYPQGLVAEDTRAVSPGDKANFTWYATSDSGPGDGGVSSGAWLYGSTADQVSDTFAGLFGPIIVTRKGMAINATAGNLAPNDVTREFVTLFFVSNENASPHLTTNINTYCLSPSQVDTLDDGFVESNLMHSINGYVFGNLMGLDMTVGETVRWYPMGLGSEADMHAVHWHGQTLLRSGHRFDVVEMMPAMSTFADMLPDAPGIWMYHCHVNDHISAGMVARYTVNKPGVNIAQCADQAFGDMMSDDSGGTMKMANSRTTRRLSRPHRSLTRPQRI